jgi:hypothetical protein
MQRHIAVAASVLAVSLAVLLPSAPAFAITAKQKMATCEFGADHPEGGGPKLVGGRRKQFMARCMSNKNDPRGPAVGTPGSHSAAGEPPEEPEPK